MTKGLVSWWVFPCPSTDFRYCISYHDTITSMQIGCTKRLCHPSGPLLRDPDHLCHRMGHSRYTKLNAPFAHIEQMFNKLLWAEKLLHKKFTIPNLYLNSCWSSVFPTFLRHTPLNYATSHCASPQPTGLRHTQLYYATPQWASPHPTEIYHTPLSYATPHSATPHPTKLRHTPLALASTALRFSKPQ